jgi:chromosomal replication initiator protein
MKVTIEFDTGYSSIVNIINTAKASNIDYHIEKYEARVKSDKMTINKIRKVVCDFFEIEENHLVLKTRKREIVQARQICHHFARKYTKRSFSEIGRSIGNKDHATVMHSLKVVNDLMDTDREYREMIIRIDDLLNHTA